MARTPRPTSATSSSCNTSSAAETEDNGGTSTSSSGGGGGGGGELPMQAQSQLFPSVSNPQISYALPQWLFPEKYKDKQSSLNTTATRTFSIPLPEVPTKTRQAIRAYLVKHHPQKLSGTKDSARKLLDLKVIRQEEKQAASKVKAAKDKLAQALLAKSEKLKEIRKAQEVETTKAMEELETAMRAERQKEDLQIEERIKEVCKLEYEKKFEEEITHKRKREQEEDEKEQAEAEVSKKAKQDKEATSSSSSSSDGGGTEGKSITTTTSSKVVALEKKQEDLQGKMEKLSEKKSEMIWLFRQVIKQEALQKLKKMKMKKKAEAK